MPAANPKGHRLVIVGGGAGGLPLAARLGDRYGRDGPLQITLVDSNRERKRDMRAYSTLALLRAEKVAVVPGNVFGASGEGHIRCSYATSMENIREAMDRIERFSASL